MKIWTWQECLNYLQSHSRHSNYFSKSQSPAALFSLSPDQLFCFISLITFLNMAGVLELFAVTSSTFQSLLQVTITTCTAQIHPRLALCFISLIKSESLNLAGLLQYLEITYLTFQVLLIINTTTWTPGPSNTHSPRAMHHWLGLVLLLVAGYWSSSQNLTTESRAKLTRSSCIPQQASASAQSWCSALAGTGKGPAKQQLINLMKCALVECVFQCRIMAGCKFFPAFPAFFFQLF